MFQLVAVLIAANASIISVHTNQNQGANSDVWSWAQPITAVGVIAAFIVSFLAFRSQKRHGQYQRLIEVYKIINNVEEREARKNVYSAFRIYMRNFRKNGTFGKVYKVTDFEQFKRNEILLDIFRDPDVLFEMGMYQDELQKDVERVRATFDHIGALFDSRLIPEKPLLKALWGTGRVCWICLAQNIYIERDKRGTAFYMNNFKVFFDKIESYRRNHVPKLQPVEPT